MQKSRFACAMLALVWLTASGCGESEAETPPTETTDETQVEAEPTEAEPTEAEPAEAEPTEAAAEPAEAEPAAAEAGGEPAGTPCDQYVAQIQQLRAAMEARLGGNQAPPLDVAGIRERCNTLSAGAQQCLIATYAQEHAEECAGHQAEIQGLNQ